MFKLLPYGGIMPNTYNLKARQNGIKLHINFLYKHISGKIIFDPFFSDLD